MERILTYKMTHDVGFAPNPFHGVLTLATCMPHLRRSKQRRVGEWMIGFAGKTLARKTQQTNITEGAIIWIGRISEPPLYLGDYFDDPRFKYKKPSRMNKISICGDNIYKRDSNELEAYPKSLGNVYKFHPCKSQHDNDKGGRNVLIFKEFYYLGHKAFLIPDSIDIQISTEARIKYVCCQSEEIAKLIKYIECKYSVGQIGVPCEFGENEVCPPRKSKKNCGSGGC